MALLPWKWIIFTIFLSSNVACGWLSLSIVGLSSTTVRRLVTFNENKTLKKKIRMTGSMWCHLSFSSGRKQVCLKYLARPFHTDASSSSVVWWKRVVKEAFISQTAAGPTGPATKLWFRFFLIFNIQWLWSYSGSWITLKHELISCFESR